MSRFVAAGADDASADKDDAWAIAQQKIDATKTAKKEAAKQEGGSLYETLQANKAAKQEAFEESIRLKNQFRTLDEDEADFLESVLASTRAEEAKSKKETSKQLAIFREQQQAAEKATLAAPERDSSSTPSSDWTVRPRKRKQQAQLITGARKRQDTSASMAEEVTSVARDGAQSQTNTSGPEVAVATEAPLKKDDCNDHPDSGKIERNATLLGLANYSSDSDD